MFSLSNPSLDPDVVRATSYEPDGEAGDLSVSEASRRSWIGKLVRDTCLRTYGVVHDVIAHPDGPQLVARFEGDSTSRRIALQARRDIEYLLPNDPRARYRALDRDDRDFVDSLIAVGELMRSVGLNRH